jgi:hypothetical protein
VALAEFERTGRISWTSDLADIPQQYGVSNSPNTTHETNAPVICSDTAGSTYLSGGSLAQSSSADWFIVFGFLLREDKMQTFVSIQGKSAAKVAPLPPPWSVEEPC